MSIRGSKSAGKIDEDDCWAANLPSWCRLPGLLQELEDSKAELGISSFGLSVTTLEEVFLAVSAAASEEAKARKQSAAKLEARSAPSAGTADAEEQKHDTKALDEKADAAACDGEQQSAAKPHALIRVRPEATRACRLHVALKHPAMQGLNPF